VSRSIDYPPKMDLKAIHKIINHVRDIAEKILDNYYDIY
jgi:hypothetical protein